ncbi:uncharacterized protein LOC119724687 isoform X2 [Patiria miniata]|nr:uncharacterized protein LOC119724687 isoform X2 [Patiria miniata]
MRGNWLATDVIKFQPYFVFFQGSEAGVRMVHQHKNVFLSLKGREIGFGGRIRRHILSHFAEEIAATSSTDNKACNLPGSRCTFLVTFSHDHKLVASSHGNHTLNISRLTTGEHIRTLTGHPRSPWCVTFHPSCNEILASGCLGGEVRVWDLQGRSEVWQSDNHSMIASLSFHPRDQVLAIATQDQILLWDWRQPVPFASVAISSPLEKVRLVRFSPLGHNLLTGIANAPVDEEEPEYENLDVQHEAYQSTTRHSRHGVPEHLNPYPRPPRLDPTLQGTYPSSLPSSQGFTAAARLRRPMSPIQNETLEEAREYAAAVTLTALGLRRVNPTRNLAHDYSYDGSRTGGQNLPNEQSDERESIFSRGARHASVIHSNAGTQNDSPEVRGENGGRSGISSWDLGESSDDTRGDMRSSDDAVSEDSQSTDRMSNVSIEESRNFSAPVYVNMDVTNGDEIRIARTSLSIPQTPNIDSGSHVARLQQLPMNADSGTSEELVSTSTKNAAASDQRSLAPGNELRPLDLVSSKKYGILPSTSSQHEQDSQNNETQSSSPSNSENKDCHSPEAKRHCPDLNSQDQTLSVKDTSQNNDEHSLSGPSSSSRGERSAKPGHSARQRLSFSDAEVSSVVQNVELLPRGDGESPVTETVASSHIVSSTSSQDTRLQSSDANSNSILTVQSSSSEAAATDSDTEMQPALQSQTLAHPRATVMHRDIGGIIDQPRAFTAHLGTIPHTAPPERTSDSDDTSTRRSTSHSSNDSHSLDISSEIHVDRISQSDTVSSTNTSSIASISLPTSSTNYANVVAEQTRPPQFGYQGGARALHFGSRSAINSGSNLNPLDLSIARSPTSSHTEVRSNIQDLPLGERHLESSGNSIQEAFRRRTSPEAPSQSSSANDHQSETRLVQDTRPNRESPVRSHYQTDFQPPVPQGIDLSIPHVRQGTRPPYAPVLTSTHTSGAGHMSHMSGSYMSRQQELASSSVPEPIPEPLTSLQPSNPFPVSDAASRYRRYNLWRSPGLHRQRTGGLTQNPDLRDGDSLMGDNQADEPRAGVVYGARRVAPLHTRRQPHLALFNQPSRQMTDIERMDMAARVQRRLLRQSRQGPLRAQLGRLTGQFSGQFSGHHHHPRNSIFDESYQPPPPMIHATINRAIASAFAGRGETAVANNIGNTTYRLQWWDFSEFELPDISDPDHNVIVPHCKIHNDASCDVSQDGRYLAAFVPSPLGFPDDGVLAIYSLMPHNFSDVLYTKSFGPNAITVNISPLSGFVIVGLASRRLHLHMASKQLMGMIYKLHKEGASEDSLLYVCDVDHTCSDQERRHHVSVNTVKWIPRPGGGLVYGTNRGDLRICSPA